MLYLVLKRIIEHSSDGKNEVLFRSFDLISFLVVNSSSDNFHLLQALKLKVSDLPSQGRGYTENFISEKASGVLKAHFLQRRAKSSSKPDCNWKWCQVLYPLKSSINSVDVGHNSLCIEKFPSQNKSKHDPSNARGNVNPNRITQLLRGITKSLIEFNNGRSCVTRPSVHLWSGVPSPGHCYNCALWANSMRKW